MALLPILLPLPIQHQATISLTAFKAVQSALAIPKPQFPDRTQAVIESTQYDATQADLRAKQQQSALINVPAPTIAPTPPIMSQIESPMMSIFMRESGNNPHAINASSGACGLGQAEPCSKLPCSLDDYNCQVNFFTQYANSRYGGWPQAWDFWQQMHYW